MCLIQVLCAFNTQFPPILHLSYRFIIIIIIAIDCYKYIGQLKTCPVLTQCPFTYPCFMGHLSSLLLPMLLPCPSYHYSDRQYHQAANMEKQQQKQIKKGPSISSLALFNRYNNNNNNNNNFTFLVLFLFVLFTSSLANVVSASGDASSSSSAGVSSSMMSQQQRTVLANCLFGTKPVHIEDAADESSPLRLEPISQEPVDEEQFYQCNQVQFILIIK